jgi:hypothetical protein
MLSYCYYLVTLLALYDVFPHFVCRGLNGDTVDVRFPHSHASCFCHQDTTEGKKIVGTMLLTLGCTYFVQQYELD